jgi:CBS domain-containing protein
MKVRNLMRIHVVTLGVSDTLDLAEDIMRMGRIRHLPVVEADNRLVGILSQRDLFKASLSSVLGFAQEKEHEWLGKVPVREVMTQEVVTTEPEVGVVEAVDKLIAGKFGCLPVVDNGRLVGLLTETDCLRCFRDLLKAGTFAELLS